jgi:Protein of unknown function (DUF3096)
MGKRYEGERVPVGFSEVRKKPRLKGTANFGKRRTSRKSARKKSALKGDKVRSSIRSSRQSSAEPFSMTLTVAHVSPILSVIAGFLILIMPRLLNFVVALFLILNGLIGLGLLRWLHM